MHLTKSPNRSSSSSSSSNRISYKFECHSNSKQNSNTGKMAAEARTISQPGHIRDRRLRSLPHILLLAIAVVALHLESGLNFILLLRQSDRRKTGAAVETDGQMSIQDMCSGYGVPAIHPFVLPSSFLHSWHSLRFTQVLAFEPWSVHVRFSI
uniref:GG12090 n=1 Tax=Drosophila erecta TaxID=7220 RepID=B3P5W9_DROER